MIKFIATDLDGTLLDEHGALPEEIFPLARRLFERGILFAPASGRQYANLKKLFFPVWEKLLFICENGALAKRGGEIVYLNPIPVSLVKDALDAVRGAGGLFPILCGAENAYVENAEEPFFSRARAAYTRCVKVDNLDECIRTEPVCKISVFDEIGAENHAMRVLPARLNGVKLTLSGALLVRRFRRDCGQGRGGEGNTANARVFARGMHGVRGPHERRGDAARLHPFPRGGKRRSRHQENRGRDRAPQCGPRACCSRSEIS